MEEFYRQSSCATFFEGIRVPLVCINAQDDPLVPPPILDIVKQASARHKNIVFVEQKYGGHLGFYEGGFIVPNSVSWLDKTVVNLADALAQYTGAEKDKAAMAAEDFDHHASLSSGGNSSGNSSGSDSEFESASQGETPDVSPKKMKRPSFVCKRPLAIVAKSTSQIC